jgi:protein SCO1
MRARCGPARGGTLLAALLAGSVWFAGCGPKENVRNYPLRGEVVSVDKPHGRIFIEHEAIPGYMGAMTMPFHPEDPAVLDRARPGEHIEATLVVSDEKVRLEKVVLTEGAKPAGGNQRPGGSGAFSFPTSGPSRT